MATNDPNARAVEGWMKDLAQNRQPPYKLVFNKDTRRFEKVPLNDPRADRMTPFTKDDLRKFIHPTDA